MDGLETHALFFDGSEALEQQVIERCQGFGLALPMMCFSPDFTQLGGSSAATSWTSKSAPSI